MRYVNLSSILAYTKITSSLAERLPRYETFIEKKLLLPHEVKWKINPDEYYSVDDTNAPVAPFLFININLSTVAGEDKEGG